MPAEYCIYRQGVPPGVKNIIEAGDPPIKISIQKSRRRHHKNRWGQIKPDYSLKIPCMIDGDVIQIIRGELTKSTGYCHRCARRIEVEKI